MGGAPGGEHRGGIYNDSGGLVLLADSSVADNGPVDAVGGLMNRGTVLMINSTVARNIGGIPGGTAGGIENSGGTIVLTNCTVADNQGLAAAAGGLENSGGIVVLQNTILARNTGDGAPDCRGSVSSLGTNVVGDLTGCTMTLLPTDLTGDPGLGEFTDNGTPGNGHFPLLPGSPAIDAGNDAVCPRTDQLGKLRKVPCDIGAIRFPERHKDAP